MAELQSCGVIKKEPLVRPRFPFPGHTYKHAHTHTACLHSLKMLSGHLSSSFFVLFFGVFWVFSCFFGGHHSFCIFCFGGCLCLFVLVGVVRIVLPFSGLLPFVLACGCIDLGRRYFSEPQQKLNIVHHDRIVFT